MGNKMCCEESVQQPTEIQKLEQVVHKTQIIEKREKVEEPQRSEILEELISSHTHKHQIQGGNQSVEIPHLGPRVRDIVQKHYFFEPQLASISTHIKKYGGDVYSGQLDEEKIKPNGLGKMYKQDGGLYIGHFSHGRAHGRGVFIFPDGSFYNGQFNHNQAETSAGVTAFYQSDSLKYTGGFQHNTFHGIGVETGENHRFEGKYNNGVRVEGKLNWKASDGDYDYKGSFNKNNKFQGKAILIEPAGTYEGEFANGFKHGQGFYQSKNGTKFRGHYVNNKREGKGTIYNYDGSISYQGQLKNGLPHGKGKVQGIEGDWLEGIDASLIQ